MSEYFLRVASKRQVTFPEELLTALQLKQGDEFGVQFVTPTDIRLVPYSRVRKALITPEVQAAIRKSEAAFNLPNAKLISLQDLEKRVATERRSRAKSGAGARLKGHASALAGA